MKEEINEVLGNSELKDCLKVVQVIPHYDPHPFVVKGESVQRYHIDKTKGCGAYSHEDGRTANKKLKKDGFTIPCMVPHDKHTVTKNLLLEVTKEFSAQILEDALSEGAWLDVVFKKHEIKGFGFLKTEPQIMLLP